MKAVWYERFGPAREVLVHGDLPDPAPAPGEVLVRLRASGVNPSDVKLRAGARPGAAMPGQRVIPHSDGAGEIAEVGAGVDRARIGERVWIWNGQWRRMAGAAADLIALPAEQAVRLPDPLDFASGACLGIPAMTAWTCLFRDGAIEGQRVLVTGGAGSVGRFAIAMAKLGGAAQVIATVSGDAKAAHAGPADVLINYHRDDVTEAVRAATGGAGVDRIVDVDFGANLAASAALIREGGVISTYASMGAPTPALPFYDLMFRNVTIQTVLVYLLDAPTRRRGEAALGAWGDAGLLDCAVAARAPLSETAAAHEMVEKGEKLGTVVVEIPD